ADTAPATGARAPAAMARLPSARARRAAIAARDAAARPTSGGRIGTIQFASRPVDRTGDAVRAGREEFARHARQHPPAEGTVDGPQVGEARTLRAETGREDRQPLERAGVDRELGEVDGRPEHD